MTAVGNRYGASNQLPEKELKIYELELRVKDLKAEVKELSDAREKLQVANRNARILEEENNNLHRQLKAVEGNKRGTFIPDDREAIKIIKENADLRIQLEECKAIIEEMNENARADDVSFDKKMRDVEEERSKLSKEKERLSRELESARRQCIELQRRVEDDEETMKVARDLWEQEKEQYARQADEQHTIIKRMDGINACKDYRGKERSNNEPLQVILLKEEVQELERKLKESQERLNTKERETRENEVKLRNEMEALKYEGESAREARETRNDKEIFRTLQGQITDLKHEIALLQKERRALSAFPSPSIIDDNDSCYDPDAHSVISTMTAPSTLGRTEEAFRRLGQQYDTAMKENESIRDQLDKCKSNCLHLQSEKEEKDVRCRELEVKLAAARRASAPTSPATASLPLNRSAHSPGKDYNETSQKDENPALKKKIRELQNDLNAVHASQEQRDTINNIRVKELQSQIDELLEENASARQHAGEADGNAVILVNDADGVMRLAKERRDSIEDVMRLLEAAWASDDDAKRQLRKARFQGAALANHDAMKDDEIARLQRALTEAEDRLRDGQADLDDVNRHRDALNNINKDKDDQIDDLKKRIRFAEAEKDDLKRQLKDKAGDGKQLNKEAEVLKQKLRDLEAGNRDMAQKHNEDLTDMNKRIDEMKNENERLRRQNAMPRDSPRRSNTPRAIQRSPRVSARRLTPDVSQLSIRSSDERKRNAIPEGAHLGVTVVELCDVLRNGRPITEPGYIVIKLKSIKEKYKTSVKELSSVVRFDETFVFYLAQPDQDVITLHVFYKPKSSSKDYHIGDACFSMATLHRGVARQRIAPVVQDPGTRDGRRSAQVEVILQTDDFGKMTVPTEHDIEDENLRFNELATKFENSAREKLHAVDVYMASAALY